jgi:hypothetical protein
MRGFFAGPCRAMCDGAAMPKKFTVKEANRERKEQESFANVLEATGLSLLKPIKPVRKAKAAPAKAKPKVKAKAKTKSAKK